MSSSEIALDLSRQAWKRTRGNVTAIGSWWREEGGDWEPCIALVRTGEEAVPGTVPCVIPLGSAYRYVPGVGNPVDTMESCIAFMRALRLDGSQKTAVWLFTLINDCLQDVMTQWPVPPHDAPGLTLGEITLTNRSTGVTTEHLLTDV